MQVGTRCGTTSTRRLPIIIQMKDAKYSTLGFLQVSTGVVFFSTGHEGAWLWVSRQSQRAPSGAPERMREPSIQAASACPFCASYSKESRMGGHRTRSRRLVVKATLRWKHAPHHVFPLCFHSEFSMTALAANLRITK